MRAFSITLALFWGGIAFAETPAIDDYSTQVNFNRDIRPILSRNCFACHGPDEENREAELRLDLEPQSTHSDAARAISPGKPEESEVWLRISSRDPDVVMPPPDTKKQLSTQEQAAIRRWIEQGAVYENHWSFIRPQQPAIPDLEGVKNPIDAFIQARLRREGLSPAPPAPKETLIRRVTLELTGLPPTLAEVDAFLADPADDAYDKLVDRLQAQLTYGEHMARYWLDLARYADTHGLHLDNERSMWPYRDWVVRAFNENLPFDQFTLWQLAGDLLPEPTRDQLIASGFNRCNVTTGEGGSINEEWIYRYAVERTSTTAEVWMGLTAGCAVCHDHKFDPLSTQEYYSMYAFFHSAADPAMDGNKLDTPPILKLPSNHDKQRLDELQGQIAALDARIDQLVRELDYAEPTDPKTASDPSHSWQAWTAQTQAERNKSLPDDLRRLLQDRNADCWSEAESERVFQHWLRHVYASARDRIKPLEAQQQSLRQQLSEIESSIPLTFVMADLEDARESFVMLRGAYDRPGQRVRRGVPGFLPSLGDKPQDRDYNRLDLAKWIVDPQHPLTARVTVNRFWQQFFGTGIVATSEDFGTQGQLPSHPQLLDWLAVQFIHDGWDVKQLVKRIVTSETYRQSSKVGGDLLQRDPQNRLLARGPRLRLDAEVLRDQALFVSGLLVPQIGGKGVNPYQPPNIWEPVGFGSSNTRYYKQGSGRDLYRRSLYTFLKRTAPPPFMSTFDAPNREQSCSRRGRSNTPMQALQLMNDIQHVEAARKFGERILTEGGHDATQRIRWGWRVVTSRLPEPAEVDVALRLLTTMQRRYAADAAAAQQLISYGESQANAEIDHAELASYTMLANLLLNLDESVNKN